jgi:tRNA pseudouridine55 synthase
VDGVVNVHKIAGPTSHDVVDQVRRIFGQKRVGHAGTLDPMATGVLVVCLGKATRIVEYLTSTEKEYRAVMTLGVATDTQDSTGEIIAESDASGLDLEQIKLAAASFTGNIEQIPPMISAIKHEGKPLYKHAREGRTIERAPRPVTVHSIEVGGFSIPPGILPGGGTRAEVELVVRCSSGTYIRTLCADIGDALGCGGMMSKLERTRVGRFTLDGAMTVDDLEQARSEDRLAECVAGMSDALDDMAFAFLDAEGAGRVIHGLAVPVDEMLEVGSTVRLLSRSGELLAIGYAADVDGVRVVKPRKVLL